MAENRVLDRWAAGRKAIAAWMSTNSLLVAQALAASGVDAVVIDMQHGSASLGDVAGLAAAIELRGAEPFVRIPSFDPGLVGRALDSGATGIIAPLIESAGQARDLVEAILYPPLGSRSFGPRVPAFRHGPGYARIANDEVVALAMIETAAGMDALDEILATPRLSGVFIGPGDLSLSLGHLPQGEAPIDVVEAIDRIRSKAAQAGARTGIFCARPGYAERALAEGFDLVTIPPDLVMVQEGAAAALECLQGTRGG